MISSHSNSSQCASPIENLADKPRSKIEGAPELEPQPEIVSKLTRKLTIRKFYRSQAGKQVYICFLDSCSRQFNHLSSLIKHERIHRNERPYKCGTCGQSFIQSSNLKRHEQSHTGEKPFACELCPKQFSTACNLRQHTQIHMKCPGELNYACNRCGKSYIYTSSLLKHRKKCAVSSPKIEDVLPKVEVDSLKIEAEEDITRKLLKTEEKLEYIPESTSPQILERIETSGHIESTERFTNLKEKILADLSNSVRSQTSSAFSPICSFGSITPLSTPSYSIPQLSMPQYSTYLNYKPTFNPIPQFIQNTGFTDSRLGFGFNNQASLFNLQNISSLSPFRQKISSDTLLQVAYEHPLLQHKTKLQNCVQSSLLRNGYF